MTSNELYQKYIKILSERTNLESKIDELDERRKNKETLISDKEIEKTIEAGKNRLKSLLEEEQEAYRQYKKQEELEQKEKSATISIEHNLGTRPTKLTITDGIISSNAKETHLNAIPKTDEELEKDKEALLNQVKQKVLTEQMSKAEASKLVADINTFYNPQEEIEKPRHK